jgi:hypothetical protein
VRSTNNDAAGKCAQILKGVETTEKGVRSDDAQVAEHRESREGIAGVASQQMNSDSEQISRDDGCSANKHSQKLSTSKPSSNASGRQGGYSAWGDRLSELADNRTIHGHCNVPHDQIENKKLATWVTTQRSQYRLHLEEKKSRMTTFRINDLESLDFDWGVCVTAWEDRLNELSDYRKIHGHCNVPHNYNEDSNLGKWVTKQRSQYRLHAKGKTSHNMTTVRIQELESLGFEWAGDGYGVTATWEDRLSELSDYRKIHGHCNVPYNCSENTKLVSWVGTQRSRYRLRSEGKRSPMTLSRIKGLESMGFEWAGDGYGVTATWEDRLSELSDYRKIHGHCNVPRRYSENAKLGTWARKQRYNYRLHSEGKTSPMTLSRIQELESMGFEWDSHGTAWEDRLSELADYRGIHGHCNVPQKYNESSKLAYWVTSQRS